MLTSALALARYDARTSGEAPKSSIDTCLLYTSRCVSETVASLLGCGMVGTETGAPNAEYKFWPECRSDEALSTFIKNFKPVVRCAEQYGVTIAIERCV